MRHQPSRSRQPSASKKTASISSEQELTTCRFYADPVVTLLIGESDTPFYVHLNLLCDASHFFKAAFMGDFKESSEKTMRLPEDDESILELFVDWLYYQCYEMIPEEDARNGDSEGEGNSFHQAFRLYVFADKYEVFKLKRLVIEKIFAVCVQRAECGGSGPAITLITYAYEHTTQDSGLRKLLADWYAWAGDAIWFKSPSTQAFLRQKPEFSADINLSFAINVQKGPDYEPFKRDMPEDYYDKEADQEKGDDSRQEKK